MKFCIGYLIANVKLSMKKLDPVGFKVISEVDTWPLHHKVRRVGLSMS